MQELLPNGVLGIAVTGLLAAFMAGMAANVSSASTPSSPTTSGRPYVRKDRAGRRTTCGSAGSSRSSASSIGIGTAFIAAGYSNIMNYIQTLFSFFNAPLFATFIIGMFWKRMTAWAGFWALLAGTLGALVATYLRLQGAACRVVRHPTWTESFWGAVIAFVVAAVRGGGGEHVHPAEAGGASCKAWLRDGATDLKPGSWWGTARGTATRCCSAASRSVSVVCALHPVLVTERTNHV